MADTGSASDIISGFRLTSESEFYPFLLKMKYVNYLEKFCYGCGIFYAYEHLNGR